jgi:lambda family phage portal protein
MALFRTATDALRDADALLPVQEHQPERTVPVFNAMGPAFDVWHDGDKYPGSYGETYLAIPDYWTLRARSADLYQRDHYARGIIRRLVTNEINTGLALEAVPSESILGKPQDSLAPWSEMVEERFHIWGKEPRTCDYGERLSFGSIQAQARTEALVVGDVLCVLRQDPRTHHPRVQLINGASVQTPMGAEPRRGNEIVHGVELDPQKRQVAYWVQQEDGTSKRLPAYGERSGRRIAWLLYGTDKRLDEVRGQPLLAVVLYSLKEIGRYRDSVQRKASLNAMVAMFMKKTEDKPGTRSYSGAGLVAKGSLATATDAPRNYKMSRQIPGVVLEELQHGEEPVAFPSHGTDEKFGDFESAIVGSIAWALEIPAEILELRFSNNYSASQAAINEFKIYLNRVRHQFGEDFCHRVYVEWLLAEVLQGKIEAAGLLEAWRDPNKADTFGAWTLADWCGHIKPSTDTLKQARGYKMMLDMGLITRDRAAREMSGTKYSKNVKRLKIENEQLVDALLPLQELNITDDGDGPPDDGFGEGGGEAERQERDAQNRIRRIA